MEILRKILYLILNGEKQFNFRIPSDLVPVNKLTNTSDSSKQVVTLDEYINSGKI